MGLFIFAFLLAICVLVFICTGLTVLAIIFASALILTMTQVVGLAVFYNAISGRVI